MNQPSGSVVNITTARVVQNSEVSPPGALHTVNKLMLNIMPNDEVYEPGMDVAFKRDGDGAGWHHYTVEQIGEVPFEGSIDLTLYIRQQDPAQSSGVSAWLCGLETGEQIEMSGPCRYPFYPPNGSRSNIIMIGAGAGMVPFRWLARKIQNRGLDWMGKVLMLNGAQTGLDEIYLNDSEKDLDQYFDHESFRAFEALKTRYSATAIGSKANVEAHAAALWQLLGQGSVYVYLAGYRDVIERFDQAMQEHVRMPGRWEAEKTRLMRNGHWQQFLYD